MVIVAAEAIGFVKLQTPDFPVVKRGSLDLHSGEYNGSVQRYVSETVSESAASR